MAKTNLKGLPLTELEAFVGSIDEPKYRAKQIFAWLYDQKAKSFDEMTNLSQPLRKKLNETAALEQLGVADRQRSTRDGTVKFLFQLSDGLKIETVLIPPRRESIDAGTRLTLCVSTQVGCPLDCRFCATGTMGFTRNLTSGEIVDQILTAQSLTEKPITNIVYMGMGEPMLNYENVMTSVDILSNGVGISPRRITISTAGYADQIKRMADEGRKPKLALSLHSLNNETRLRLMPITKKHNVEELLDALEYYFRKTKKSVMLEYILFDKENDSDSDVQKIIKASHRFRCRVNLIPFHSIDAGLPDGRAFPSSLRTASRETMIRFAEKLRRAEIPVFIRDSSGEDIDAACGQLAIRNQH